MSIWEFIASSFAAIGSLLLFQGIEDIKAKIGASLVFVSFIIIAYSYAVNITDVLTRLFSISIISIFVLLGIVLSIIVERRKHIKTKLILEMTENELHLAIREEVMHALLDTLPKTVDAIETRIKSISSNDNNSSH